MPVFENTLVRVLQTGETHYGQANITSAGEESAFGAEHTDMVAIGPNRAEAFPLSAVSITNRDECPSGADNHYE